MHFVGCAAILHRTKDLSVDGCRLLLTVDICALRYCGQITQNYCIILLLNLCGADPPLDLELDALTHRWYRWLEYARGSHKRNFIAVRSC